MMKASAMAEYGRLARHDLSTQFPVGSRTLSLGAILGIAVGGALLLFGILVTIGIIHVKKKHRREKQQFSEANEDGNVSMDLKTAIQSTRPPETNMSRRVSFNPFLPLQEDDNREEWTKQDGLQKPPVAKSKSTQRTFFRTSSVRDSWPLMTSRPGGFLPGQTTIVLSPVAPPGYVVQDPKWPKRTSSILGRKNSQDSSKSASPTRDPYSMDVMPYRTIHRRSTSENQLSTILRSTSQRLKAAQRQSMARTLSTLGRSPGLPPSERLPTPPRKATESREGLIDQENVESVGSSICDLYSRTPSPKKKHQRTSSKWSPIKPKSPTASVESKDSLCVSDTPDLVIPAPLTSPSKSSRSAQKQPANQASGGAKDISALIHQDNQVSLLATGPQETANNKNFSPPRRISLSGDPFYSPVRSPKPMMPNTQVQGPRPMYFRNATFGQEATPDRPVSFCSPLRDVSGNAQPSPKRALPEPPTTSEPNLFQSFPQGAMQTRATQTSPKRSNSRRKGHKRSNVIRMSNLSRPTSTVEIVPEEPVEVPPLKFNVPRYPSFLSVEITQDASPTKSPSSRRSSLRPPSIATFNPTLIVPALSSRLEDNSPALGSEGSEISYSPNLSACNYHKEKDSSSEDEFFKPIISTSLQPSPSVIKSRSHCCKYSADLAFFSTHQSRQHQSQQYLQERVLSFPPLPLGVVGPATLAPILTPRPASRPLPNITSTMNGLRSSAATPAPPILTIPGHLTGPRSEPGKHTRATLSPPRCDSIINSISTLRRMNSEVSTNCSSPMELDSPTLPLDSPSTNIQDNNKDAKANNIDNTTTIEERGRSRGSQHYLSLGQPSPPSRHRTRDKARHARPEIRDSHRIHKERRKRRTLELENRNMIDELTPVKEGSSPATGMDVDADVRVSGANAHLRFPTLNREGSVLVTLPRSKARVSALTLASESVINASENEKLSASPGVDRTVLRSIETPNEDNRVPALSRSDQNSRPARWSDAMPKPNTHVTRRESKMEHPSPSPASVTPPKWTTRASGLGLAGVRFMDRDAEGKVVGAEDWQRTGGGRPKSLGLYDLEGFLKCSPERERVLAGRVAEERKERKEG